MADIIYTLAGKPYLNITNQCPCACTFCIRERHGSVGDAGSLWHQTDPTWHQIEQALAAFDFSRADEAVFCGYGEPFAQLENLKRTAQWLKTHYPKLKLRVNTNGLGDLIHNRPTAQELKGLVDALSISLNAPNAQRYAALCQPVYGEKSFDAMLSFAAQAKAFCPEVVLSVVAVVTPEEIEQCRAIAARLDLPLRVRALD
ncbi:MAG: TatD family nuclease-associated radical SAM protein [Oscillospiraceae bacterium]|jgi:TatD family-associated radical SAM protein|nr:TatD family nuclease-associated radical SAM protein [Oscillospiraceae bacterium]